ncbi:CGLD27-like [Dillenia turbinata]|uniref:CGLD27-like n=1 Tax=Dillenia turbinata TaxID=194707 RepID=A0AAN8Z9H9_9MAGN
MESGVRSISTITLSSPFTSPETECPVPLDQQPINEYQNLSDSFPFSWASGSVADYYNRLIFTGVSFAVLVGLPVAWLGVINPESEPLKVVLGAVSSGVFAVTLAVVRMYLGWAYVGNRLLSATIWVKTAEVLARDRLLGSFSVKPVLSRLKFTLVGLAASLLLCVLLLANIEGTQDSYRSNPSTRAIPGVYNDESARSFEPDAFCGELSNP